MTTMTHYFTLEAWDDVTGQWYTVNDEYVSATEGFNAAKQLQIVRCRVVETRIYEREDS